MQRLKQRERRLPGQAGSFGPGISGVQRCHVGKVERRDRHVPRPIIHVAGMHGEERCLKGCDFPDETHAVLMRDAANAGDLGIERRLISGKDRDGHLVDAKPELAAFGLVGGLEELGLNRGGDVFGGSHLRDAALDATLATDLAKVTDPEVLRTAFRTRFEAGDLAAAVRTQERLLAILGDVSGTNDHANLALALVLEAEGYVSPEAEAQLRLALTRDLTNELARYLVGEMFLQGGRFDQTLRFWRPLVESGNPGAPWMAQVRDRIGMVADLAGVAYDLPEASAAGLAGPSEGEVAAAADMTPEERQAMIEGMVAQLSERLASEGGDVEDWNRLIRSLGVLERLPEAQTIYDEAKVRFEGRPAELSFLRLAAVETGLNP